MFSTDIALRVRYAETDKMGYVYYGNYAVYYEVGRVEALRQLGFSYSALEKEGIIMPVVSLHIDYIKPAHYDEVLRLVVQVSSPPLARLTFDYKLYNAEDELLNQGSTILAFLQADTRRICRVPATLQACLAGFFTPDGN